MKYACNNVPMLILIDESGDAGFKVAKGSTSHFVVAMVIFRDLKQAELASAAIGAARERLRAKPELRVRTWCAMASSRPCARSSSQCVRW